jgi:hypothetical protein
LKLTHVKVGQLGMPNSRGKRHVTICSQFDKPDEFMTITVTVLNDGSDEIARASGIARAKDFARQFADSPLESFPAGIRSVRG